MAIENIADFKSYIGIVEKIHCPIVNRYYVKNLLQNNALTHNANVTKMVWRKEH